MSSLPFRLLNEVDTTGFGDTAMRLGDLDGDGELEVVWFQARDCHIPRMSAGGYRHEKQVHCITAMKLDGDVMWQEGAPLGTERFEALRREAGKLPVVALGGIEVDNVAAVRTTGAAGVAVIRALRDAADTAAVARLLAAR